MQPHHSLLLRIGTVVLIAAGAACAAEDDSPALGPAAEAGREIVRSNGCSACHGRNGEGGPGPQLVGLFGSTVELRDGGSVVADAEYLYESIRDPDAKIVAGYGFPMPENDLSDAEIESVIAFIQELADTDQVAG